MNIVVGSYVQELYFGAQHDQPKQGLSKKRRMLAVVRHYRCFNMPFLFPRDIWWR